MSDDKEIIVTGIPEKINVNCIEFQKMSFIYNAIQSGWEVKLNNKDKYVFKKKHENQKEIYLENYLKTFVEENVDFNHLIN
mgnify:FL=1|jgi:hypothetical protein|tara:strand:+ start:124 stop:366 length:243 start_codon:yes stop_codon:yes gene_type:complete